MQMTPGKITAEDIAFFNEVYAALPKPKSEGPVTVRVFLHVRERSPIRITRYLDESGDELAWNGKVVEGCYHDWFLTDDGRWEVCRNCTCPEGTPCDCGQGSPDQPLEVI